MVNTTVPLPAPTLSPVILMLQLTRLDTPPSTTPLTLDILTPTTPLSLDILPSTRLPSTTKLFKSNKSLGKQPQLKNRFFPQELQLPKENTRSYVHSYQINI